MIRTTTTAVFLAASLAVAAQRPIRVDIELVHFAVVVTDRQGAPIGGLKLEDFEVLERGKPQEVRFFASADTGVTPDLHLGFLLDASGSMEADIRDVRTAAIKFLNQNEYAKDVTLVDFDTEVRVTRYSANDYPRLIESIRRRKPGGYTAFYDALGVYLRTASTQDGQKILVVYTDGGDTRSTMTASDVTELLKLSDGAAALFRDDRRPRLLSDEPERARRALRENPERDRGPLHPGLHLLGRQGGRLVASGRDQAETTRFTRREAAHPAWLFRTARSGVGRSPLVAH